VFIPILQNEFASELTIFNLQYWITAFASKIYVVQLCENLVQLCATELISVYNFKEAHHMLFTFSVVGIPAIIAFSAIKAENSEKYNNYL